MKNLLKVTLIAIALASFTNFNVAFAMWHPTKGIEEIDTDLYRVDHLPNSPYHEINKGTYGYWENSQTFITVIDFLNGTGPVSPFTWDDVEWIPGPMDWGWETSNGVTFDHLCELIIPSYDVVFTDYYSTNSPMADVNFPSSSAYVTRRFDA